MSLSFLPLVKILGSLAQSFTECQFFCKLQCKSNTLEPLKSGFFIRAKLSKIEGKSTIEGYGGLLLFDKGGQT